jgi:hypothetical protein
VWALAHTAAILQDSGRCSLEQNVRMARKKWNLPADLALYEATNAGGNRVVYRKDCALDVGKLNRKAAAEALTIAKGELASCVLPLLIPSHLNRFQL